MIEDLGSRNGTWVNGVRVERQRLEPGDLIRVGEIDVRAGRRARRSSLLYDDELIRPWYEHALEVLAPGAALVDIHGHTGFNDPDGFTFSSEQLLATLDAAGARGVVMPMHEPDGYPPANDRVLAEAAASGRPADRVLPARSEARRGRRGDGAASTRAPVGSSSTRGQRASSSGIPRWSRSSRSRTSGGCRS